MNINRENYGMYFLDYHEGRLTPGQVAELLVFLQAHPELKEELEDFENIRIKPDLTISFADKTSLKKKSVSDFGPINASNYETYFIADTEKQLTTDEQRWLDGFLEKNPWLKRTYQLYLLTRLQPDLHIHYPGKSGLKRSIFKTRSIYYYALSAAASVALLLAVFMNSGIKQPSVLTASQKPLTIPAPENRKISQEPLQQPGSAPTVAYNPASAGHPVDLNQLPGQVVLHDQPKGERTPVTEIQSRLQTHITTRDIVKPEYLFIRQNRNNPQIYATLYDQINLAERMQQEQVLAPVASSPKSMLQSGLRKLGDLFTGRESTPNHGTFNFWTIADLGISGYNLLTDKDLKLLTQSNDSGKVVSYALKGEGFEFTRLQNKPKTR